MTQQLPTSRFATGRLAATLLAVGLLALLAAAGPAAAAPEAAVLGSEGAVLQLHSGLYADLFPGDATLAADSAVLALDIRRGGEVDRMLVPGTESAAAEEVATLLHESSSGLTYLLWEGLLNGTHPVLYLTTWNGESWGEIYDVTGNPFARKGDPRLVVHRDLGAVEGDVDRSILHLTWWEETVGEVRWLYAPVVIENGRQVDERPVRVLGDYFSAVEASGATAPASLGLLQEGASAGSQIAAFVDAEQQIDTVEIEVVPQALSRLASGVADEVAALGAEATYEDAVDAVRRAIFLYGGGFHPSTLVFLAEEIAALFVDPELGGDYQSASAGAGIHIIHIGMRLGTAGLDDGDASEILTIGGGEALHHLKISAVATWAVPDTPRDAETVTPLLFVSRDGGDALLAWPLRHRVLYRETSADGTWSSARAVRLDESLDVETALQLLEARTQIR